MRSCCESYSFGLYFLTKFIVHKLSAAKPFDICLPYIIVHKLSAAKPFDICLPYIIVHKLSAAKPFDICLPYILYEKCIFMLMGAA